MKKIILPLILMTIFLIPAMKVKADTVTCDYSTDIPTYIEKYGKEFVVGEFDKLYEKYLSDYKADYPYYTIEVMKYTHGGSTSYLGFILTSYTEANFIWKTDTYTDSSQRLYYFPNYYISTNIATHYANVFKINEDGTLTYLDDQMGPSTYNEYININKEADGTVSSCRIKLPFYSNMRPPFLMNDDFTEFRLQETPTSTTYRVLNSSTTDYIFGEYVDFVDGVVSPENPYIEVNLDDYEYVILNLKNYNQTDAFSTNLKVKGMVGITPVYEFGTVEKSEITDRCNITYSDYTDYRFSILKSDLQNNAIYYVKACEDNSSFKFDKNLFDITYITSENVDDPIITIGGKNYNVIPFTKLSNTANKNEENNFIPGESKNSLTDIIDNFSDFGSDIWNAISSFMGLVTKFFNTLPEEFRYLSITAFSTLIIIAIIKFIKG